MFKQYIDRSITDRLSNTTTVPDGPVLTPRDDVTPPLPCRPPHDDLCRTSAIRSTTTSATLVAATQVSAGSNPFLRFVSFVFPPHFLSCLFISLYMSFFSFLFFFLILVLFLSLFFSLSLCPFSYCSLFPFVTPSVRLLYLF